MLGNLPVSSLIPSTSSKRNCDGVPGWSGTGKQITPHEPGASFIAHIAPPRAGTFIYHTHWHDPSQLTNGLYGPLIVLPEGKRFDPKSDLIFLFSIGDFGALQELALINGTPQSKTLLLESGRRYRFRFINISTKLFKGSDGETRT
jgi:FtsP/CotA-like multicopper oxidase with cupredoxin domain